MFTEIEFGTGACAVPTTEVNGTAWIKDCKGDSEAELLVHLVEEDAAVAAALGGLTFGTHLMNILGSVNLEVFEGTTWKKASVLKE